jgi:hypothetical protein
MLRAIHELNSQFASQYSKVNISNDNAQGTIPADGISLGVPQFLGWLGYTGNALRQIHGDVNEQN